MSGTSTDGVDAVLACFDGTSSKVELLGHHHAGFEPELRQALLSLNHAGADELHRASLAANRLCRAYGEVVAALLQASGHVPQSITAMGAHGQTVRHRPGEFDGLGYTLQLINGALLAEMTGIDVVCDFRSRDVAAGGQGAPLVPAFHDALFGRPGRRLAVLNLGGIANLTLLDGAGGVAGFDCGPGNVLLDHWAHRHLGRDHDESGNWASGGQADPALLERMLGDPYFSALPPKSTGRDRFNAEWLVALLDEGSRQRRIASRDVQATLAELTARSATQALALHLPDPDELLLCGGGTFNLDLCNRIASQLPRTKVRSTADAGIPPMQVEAAAFAWLAYRHCQRLAGNCPQVTGARGDRILGCLHPA
ncbi:MAG: anhydro-N-acetylmuramic acid kinase [Burkholderiaceae bacterium]|nr:anhydro-N-acetylmuramic acid kinase [Burkholderiaceae bacterium]